MATKKFFDVNNPDDILQIHQLLLDGCDPSVDEHFQEDDPGSPAPGPSNLVAEVPEEEFDTDAEEEIEEREENSDTSQSDSEASTDCDDTEPVFVCRRKNVLLISSMHTDGAIDEESGEKRKPEVVTYYNHHKIGVDMVDKMSGAYNVQRSTRRWPMVVFYAILNVAGINSQVISLGNGQNVPARRLFLRQLWDQFIRDQLIMRVQFSNLPRTMTSRLRELLPNDQIPPRASSNSAATDAGGRKRCGLCLENKTKRYTKYSCKECGQYLCLQHCAFSCADGCNVGVSNESDSDNFFKYKFMNIYELFYLSMHH